MHSSVLGSRWKCSWFSSVVVQVQSWQQLVIYFGWEGQSWTAFQGNRHKDGILSVTRTYFLHVKWYRNNYQVYEFVSWLLRDITDYRKLKLKVTGRSTILENRPYTQVLISQPFQTWDDVPNLTTTDFSSFIRYRTMQQALALLPLWHQVYLGLFFLGLKEPIICKIDPTLKTIVSILPYPNSNSFVVDMTFFQAILKSSWGNN